MLCYVILYYVVLCCVMFSYVIFWYVMSCFVKLSYVVLCYVMLCSLILCYVVLCCVLIQVSAEPKAVAKAVVVPSVPASWFFLDHIFFF